MVQQKSMAVIPAESPALDCEAKAALEVYDYTLDPSGKYGWCEVHHPHKSPTHHRFPIRDLVITACDRLGVAYDDVSNEEVMVITAPGLGESVERVTYALTREWYELYVTVADYLTLVQQEALQGEAWEAEQDY